MMMHLIVVFKIIQYPIIRAHLDLLNFPSDALRYFCPNTLDSSLEKSFQNCAEQVNQTRHISLPYTKYQRKLLRNVRRLCQNDESRTLYTSVQFTVGTLQMYRTTSA